MSEHYVFEKLKDDKCVYVDKNGDVHDLPEHIKGVEDLCEDYLNLREQVKRWEDKEVKRASCCDYNEQAKLAYESVLRWYGEEEKFVDKDGNPAKTFAEVAKCTGNEYDGGRRARQVLSKWKEK